MRGHLRKRGKNSWSIVLSLGYDPVTGKRQQQWISVKGSKKDADRKLIEVLNQFENGGLVKSNRLTVADFLERWLNDYVFPNVSPKTAKGYQDTIRTRLVPNFGRILLKELKPEHLQSYYAKLLKGERMDGKEGGLSARSIERYHVCIHRALVFAVKWGLVARNIADAVTPPKKQRHEMRVLNEDEIKRLLDAARDTDYYAVFYLAIYTGMRRSELLALRWQDVDLLLGQLSVLRGLHHVNGEFIFGTPKTAKSRRMVSLPPSASLMLREHKEKQGSIYLQLGKLLSENDLVFARPDGSPMRPNTITHAWIKMIRKIGLDGVRLHDARHTHATLMLKQGVHPKVVQERLGHASISITLDIYSHVTPGLQEAAARGFDEGMGQAEEVRSLV